MKWECNVVHYCSFPLCSECWRVGRYEIRSSVNGPLVNLEQLDIRE